MLSDTLISHPKNIIQMIQEYLRQILTNEKNPIDQSAASHHHPNVLTKFSKISYYKNL